MQVMKFRYLPGKVLYSLLLDTHHPVVSERVQNNHIIIFDRSGSMTWLLPEEIDDLVKLLDHFSAIDTLTLGWFSSEGEFNWIVKGMTVHGNEKAIEKKIREHSHSVALTCFSEILEDVNDHVLEDLNILPGVFTLTFTTDGYPVVSDRTREERRVMAVTKALAHRLSSVLLIGYGDYYNKELMRRMAENIGGQLIHNSRLDQFLEATTQFISSGEVTKRVVVSIPTFVNEQVFGIADGKIITYSFDGNKVLVPEGTQVITVLGEETDLLHNQINSLTVLEDNMVHELLAVAYNYVAGEKSDSALQILSKVGDVRLMRLLNSAFTNAEYGEVQEEISEVLEDPKKLYSEGQNMFYVPDPSAYCLVNALEELGNDPLASFYPRHPEFHYKRTGVPTHQAEGYPEFVTSKLVACSFGSLVWNSTRLNLSIRAEIEGVVDLGPEAHQHGLAQMFPAKQYRTYTLVRDGVLNVYTLPASMSKEMFDKLQRHYVISDTETWAADKIYALNLRNIPLVNRDLATPPLATEFCGWLNEELYLEYKAKYIGYLLDQADPDKKLVDSGLPYTDEQFAFLETKGINRKLVFSPPSVKGEAKDYYFAKEFDVKIAKFSSSPKISDVILKTSSGKSFTPSESLMQDAMSSIEKEIKETGIAQSFANYVAWLYAYRSAVRGDLAELRSKIQGTRFSILLCKQWFPDLKGRDGAKVAIGDREFTFTIREVKEDY